MKATAQCLCGSVSLKVKHNSKVHACHCGKCRTWGSGSAFALTARNPEICGVGNIGRYRASEWAERCFCKQCGTHLFVQVGEDYHINAGLFTDNRFCFTKPNLYRLQSSILRTG